MRTINSDEITAAIKEMCIRANIHLPCDVMNRLKQTAQTEINPLGQDTLQKLAENAQYAETAEMPICQDTGMACVFLEIGQDVHLTGGLLEDAVNAGVRKGYGEGYLRKSIVCDPLRRVNTGDNTPAYIHTEIVASDKIRITVAPKGFGSENMSAMRMFKSFRSVTICAAVLSVFCALLGILASILAGTPVGSTIVAVQIGAFGLSWLAGTVLGGVRR